MRKVLLSLAAGVSLMLGAGSAAADGMPSRGGGFKDVGCIPAFQGFYIGAQAGYGQYTAHQNDLDGFLTDNSGWTSTDNQFTGGVTVGYNYQRSCGTLFGVEADWSWGNLEATIIDNPNAALPNRITSSLNNYGTLRTRTGLVIDNLLLYVTGGLAWATIDFNGIDPDQAAFSFSNTRWGWTAGVGTEFLLGRNWTFKSEILYINFDDKTHSFTAGGERFSFQTQDDVWVGRAGINYKF
ncbi:MAG: outer membrane beta-barrel protein [Hyphomicrobiaceae bacterium]|jgi:outer membrane immunogenic protein